MQNVNKNQRKRWKNVKRNDIAKVVKNESAKINPTSFVAKNCRFGASEETCARFVSSLKLEGTSLGDTCAMSQLVDCNGMSAYRTIDGSCNNAENPRWGSALTAYSRVLFPRYSDGELLIHKSMSGLALSSLINVLWRALNALEGSFDEKEWSAVDNDWKIHHLSPWTFRDRIFLTYSSNKCIIHSSFPQWPPMSFLSHRIFFTGFIYFSSRDSGARIVCRVSRNQYWFRFRSSKNRQRPQAFFPIAPQTWLIDDLLSVYSSSTAYRRSFLLVSESNFRNFVRARIIHSKNCKYSLVNSIETHRARGLLIPRALDRFERRETERGREFESTKFRRLA